MNIFIATRSPFPRGTSTAARISSYAKGFISNGVNCTVITTCQKKSKNISNKIPYVEIFTPKTELTNLIFKSIYGLIGTVLCFRYLYKNLRRGDILILYGDNFFDNISFSFLKLFREIILVKELCEIPYMNNQVLNRIKRILDINFFYKTFDCFLVISENLSVYANKHKSTKASIIKVPILFDFDRLNVKNSIKDTSDIYIFHAGGLTEYKDGILTSIEAFGIALKDIEKSVKFVVAGVNRWKLPDDFNKIVSKYHLKDNIVFLDFLKPEEVIQWSLKSDISIIYKNDNVQNRNGFATKIAEALGCNTAVITTDVGETVNYLIDGFSGYIMKPQGPQILSQKIIRAINNDDERNKIIKNGKKVAEEHFDISSQTNKIISVFNNKLKNLINE